MTRDDWLFVLVAAGSALLGVAILAGLAWLAGVDVP